MIEAEPSVIMVGRAGPPQFSHWETKRGDFRTKKEPCWGSFNFLIIRFSVDKVVKQGCWSINRSEFVRLGPSGKVGLLIFKVSGEILAGKRKNPLWGRAAVN